MIASLIISFLPAIVRGVEMAFASKPKSGTEKGATAVAAARAITDKLVANGLGENPPSDEALRGMVEAVFQQMQQGGKIAPAPAPSEIERMYIVTGRLFEVNQK